MAIYKKISDVKALYLKGNRTELLKTYNKEQLRAAEAILNNFCAVVEANNLYLEKVEIEPNPEENDVTNTESKNESIVPANVGPRPNPNKPKKEKVVEEIMDEDDEEDESDTEIEEEENFEDEEQDDDSESIFK
jgi:hypothetical protein